MTRKLLFNREDCFDIGDPRSLLNWAQWLKGKTLRDSLNLLPLEKQQIAIAELEKIAKAKILPDGSYKGPKGVLGILVEIVHFGLCPDNKALADLREANLELKVTGLLKNKNGIRAKERLSLGMIDYQKSVTLKPKFEDDFEIQKSLSGMLLMTYWYKSRTTNPLDLVFHDSFIWKPEGEERKLILKDWALHQATIRTGHAHMLTERYSHALGAPPKGAGSDSDFVKQPIEKPYTYSQVEDEMIELGVEELLAQKTVKDYEKRIKIPGDGKKGYSLPKDRSKIEKFGVYPARRRCYSLTNSFLSKLVKLHVKSTS